VQRSKALLPEKDWGKQGIEKRLIKNLTKRRLGGQDDLQKIRGGFETSPLKC